MTKKLTVRAAVVFTVRPCSTLVVATTPVVVISKGKTKELRPVKVMLVTEDDGRQEEEQPRSAPQATDEDVQAVTKKPCRLVVEQY